MSMHLPSLTDSYDSTSKTTVKPRIWAIEVTTKENRQHLILLEKAISTEGNKLSITYRIIDRFNIDMHGCQGEFRAAYNASLNTLSLTGGAIFLDLSGLEGNRIGTYLMNEVIQWAKQWPDAEIETINLTDGQASPKNKERRNKFYEQFGLVFHYESDERKAGYSFDKKAGDLNTVDSWKKNIKEISILDLIASQQNEINKLNHEVNFARNNLEEIQKNIGREFFQKIIYKIREYLHL